jgi:hypothetical protein
MGRQRLAGPIGADLVGGVVANREDKVHRRGAGSGELVPGLAAQTGD